MATKIKIPKQIDVGRSKKGLTINQLLKNTHAHFPSRFKNALEYGVKVVSSKKLVDNKYRFAITEGRFGFTESKFHYVEIRNLEPDKPYSDALIAARCDCSDFCFCFEYALALRGAALEPHSSNLQPSAIKNPHHYCCGCKHLVTAFAYIKKRGI